MRCRRAFSLVVIGAALNAAPVLAADAVDAVPKDVEWFVDKWAVGTVDAPGYTTTVGTPRI